MALESAFWTLYNSDISCDNWCSNCILYESLDSAIMSYSACMVACVVCILSRFDLTFLRIFSLATSSSYTLPALSSSSST